MAPRTRAARDRPVVGALNSVVPAASKKIVDTTARAGGDARAAPVNGPEARAEIASGDAVAAREDTHAARDDDYTRSDGPAARRNAVAASCDALATPDDGQQTSAQGDAHATVECNVTFRDAHGAQLELEEAVSGDQAPTPVGLGAARDTLVSPSGLSRSLGQRIEKDKCGIFFETSCVVVYTETPHDPELAHLQQGTLAIANKRGSFLPKLVAANLAGLGLSQQYVSDCRIPSKQLYVKCTRAGFARQKETLANTPAGGDAPRAIRNRISKKTGCQARVTWKGISLSESLLTEDERKKVSDMLSQSRQIDQDC